MKYFYIHGLNSTGMLTSTQLSTILGQKVERLVWHSNLYYHNNLKFMLEQLKKEKDFVLIGSSLGGFYTMELSNILQVPCVLFNPVIYPRKSFERIKNLEFYRNIEEVVESYPKEPSNQSLLPRLVVVGRNDEILDINDALQYWHGKANVILTSDKHHIDNFDPFKEDIEKLSIPLFYDVNECV